MGGKFSNFIDSPVHTHGSSVSSDHIVNDRHAKFTLNSTPYHSARPTTYSRQISSPNQQFSSDCSTIRQLTESNHYGVVNNSATFEEEDDDKKATSTEYYSITGHQKDDKKATTSCSSNRMTGHREIQRRSCSNPDLLSALGNASSVPTGQSSSYVDPILEDINSQPPPLPPRSCTERRSMRERTDPRITPICKNGLKLSDTHYFVIPPPRRQLDNSRCRSFNNEYLNVARKNSRPRYLSDSVADECGPAQLPDLTIDMRAAEVVSDSTVECVGHPHHSGRSPKDTVPELCVQKELIDSLCRLVPSATEQEVKVILIGANWKLDEATKRLKEELLCRTGYACRSRVHYFLTENNWDLEAAVRQAKEEYEKWKPFYRQ